MGEPAKNETTPPENKKAKMSVPESPDEEWPEGTRASFAWHNQKIRSPFWDIVVHRAPSD